jgi:hypothetical protein
MVNSDTGYIVELQRKICIKKDVMEIRSWLQVIENNSTTLTHFIALEKQLIREQEVAIALMGLRRKNTLVMGAICKYEQELKKEFIYGKTVYDQQRSLIHERKRDSFNELQEQHSNLNDLVFNKLKAFSRSY